MTTVNKLKDGIQDTFIKIGCNAEAVSAVLGNQVSSTPETRNPEPETRNSELESENRRPLTGNRNPQSGTRNPKL